ncbi:hypothetical protein [Mesorhizobium sp. KR1-2]|uniref:hypothetical protein n=1 Tax=Mesorhizobium sp. KR1-2 TaxID=3156609 RepID=UPI0032B41A19
MVKIAALSLAIVVAGCTTAPEPVADPRAVWCEHNQPRRPSSIEIAAMPLPEKLSAVEHNRKGALWCGWRP